MASRGYYWLYGMVKANLNKSGKLVKILPQQGGFQLMDLPCPVSAALHCRSQDFLPQFQTFISVEGYRKWASTHEAHESHGRL